MNYKMVLTYDGSYYSGFAIQNNVSNTIQALLQKLLKTLFKSDLKLVCAGRTDKGAHAINQVVSFQAPFEIEPNKIKVFFNKYLIDHHIYIKNITTISDTFHARKSAIAKTYLYLINLGIFDIFKVNYQYQFNKDINVTKLNEIKSLFVGKKNFLSFSNTDLKQNQTIRTINWIEIKKIHDVLLFYINGDGFLRNMVRMIVATFLDYYQNKITYQQIVKLFKNPLKGSCNTNIAACGLYLYQVYY